MSAAFLLLRVLVCVCLGHFQAGSFRYRSLLEGLYTYLIEA